jgi:protein-tyrosine kinase
MRLRASPDNRVASHRQDRSLTNDRPQIGNLLTETGALSDDDVSRVLERQDQTGELFGEAAVALNLISDVDLRTAISQQQRFFILPQDSATVDPVVVAAFDPNDSLSLQVRRLRREITRRITEIDGSAIRNLALMSFGASSERCVIAANLGVTFAQAGYNTLLVDTVLDNAQLHALFRVSNRIGVSTFLSSDVEADSVTQLTSIPSLTLMTAGPQVPNASELFDRQRLARRLRPLSDLYDMILLNIGGEVALAASDGSDAALVLTRKGVSDMREIRQVKDTLATSKTVLLGSVLMD